MNIRVGRTVITQTMDSLYKQLVEYCCSFLSSSLVNFPLYIQLKRFAALCCYWTLCLVVATTKGFCYNRHFLDAAWIWAKGNDDMIGCTACSSVSTSCSRCIVLASSSCSMTHFPYVLQTLASWTICIYSMDTTLYSLCFTN